MIVSYGPGAVASGTTGRGAHVGVLLDNTPDYLFAFGGAAMAGAAVVGLNHTRVGAHLKRDIEHTDVDFVVTEPRHLPALAGLDLGVPIVVSRRYDEAGAVSGGDADDLDAVLDASAEVALPDEPDASVTWALIFTSGTSGSPKAVICSQRRLLSTGVRMTQIMGLAVGDVGYVSMPLFHSNAVMVGWAPALVLGATVGLARRFSASGFMSDVRRYGATWCNYTGKPLAYVLATPQRSDDANNTLRVAFGNEGSPNVVEEFSRRFDVDVIDAFGSTEGAISLNRDVVPRRGSVGVAGPTIDVVDGDDSPCPPARFDDAGGLVNAAECVGEIVNTAGAGPFEGYYNNGDATAAATRGGWYRSGDLGYLDDDRYLYFAGRTAEWIRVDGENFPAGPIADALSEHPDIVVAVAYGVPDSQAGDQVMVALVLRDGVEFASVGFVDWLERSSGIGPKWWPRYVRVARELPGTGTNKVVTRRLQHEKFRVDRMNNDAVWVRGRGDTAYRTFGMVDLAALEAEFATAGRERFWDL